MIFPFSIWRDELSSTRLSQKAVAEAGLDASCFGSAVTGWVWEYLKALNGEIKP